MVKSRNRPVLQGLKDRLQRLEWEMYELKGEIDAVEQVQTTLLAATLRTPAAPPTENDKASTEQERSESTIDLCGFIMTDTGYDFGQINPQWFDVERPTQHTEETGISTSACGRPDSA